MIFDKRALLALGIACAVCPFSHASKGGKNPPHSSKAHKESTPFFVASAACAQKCISAEFEPDHHLLMNAIQHCDAQSSRQMWHIVSDGTFVKVKSVAASGDSTGGDWCLGVVPQEASGGFVVAPLIPSSANICSRLSQTDCENTNGCQASFFSDMFMECVPTSCRVLSSQRDCESVMGCFWYQLHPMPPGCEGIPWTGRVGVAGGDGHEDDDMCSNGNKLGLVSCDHPTAQWSSTDGQLISPFCWGIGHSSFLSVNEGCTDLHLSTTSDGATAISRSETFMAVTQDFVETIPPPPVPTYIPTYNPTTATSTPTGSPMEPTANPTTATYTPTSNPMQL